MENNQPGNYEIEVLQMVFTPRELIKHHIKDLNHVVTDDELRKLMIGAQPSSYHITTTRELQESA